MPSRPPVLRLLVNGRFVGQSVTGVQRFAWGLASALGRRDDMLVTIAMPGVGRVAHAELENVSVSAAAKASGVHGHLWEQAILPRLVEPGEWLLSPANFGSLYCRRQIVVIHDLAPWRVPSGFTWQYRLMAKTMVPLVARRVQCIGTVSPFVRKELVDTLGLAAGRVAVIGNGVDGVFYPTTHQDDYRLDKRPFLLLVGGHDTRKNAGFAIGVWRAINRFMPIDLYITTRAPSRTLVPCELDSEITQIRDPSDAQLASLYQRAAVLVSPSHYEGFGLPLLEAAACGTPFIATDTGAARELASDPSLQLQPLDTDKWAAALHVLLTQPEVADAVAQGQLRRASSFTWDQAAERLVGLMRQET